MRNAAHNLSGSVEGFLIATQRRIFGNASTSKTREGRTPHLRLRMIHSNSFAFCARSVPL